VQGSVEPPPWICRFTLRFHRAEISELGSSAAGSSSTTATWSVRTCEAAGITLAVNQNMRYDQSVRAAKTLLGNGAVGEPIIATIDMRGIPHWMPWQAGLGWVTLRIMSIHQPANRRSADATTSRPWRWSTPPTKARTSIERSSYQ
jgi:hypothetical protein